MHIMKNYVFLLRLVFYLLKLGLTVHQLANTLLLLTQTTTAAKLRRLLAAVDEHGLQMRQQLQCLGLLYKVGRLGQL